MINWNNCPKVESVPDRVSGQLGIQRHQATGVFPL